MQFNMIHKIFIFSVILLSFTSCGSLEKKMPVRKPLPITAMIADTLFTRLPGSLRVNSKHLALICNDNRDNFLSIYDKVTGQQLNQIGSIGQGPEDWLIPSLGNVINDKLVVYDMDKWQFVLANADNMYRDISNRDAIQKLDRDIYRFIYLAPNRYILADFEEKYPFKMVSKDRIDPCGRYPFQEKISNTDCFQGPLEKHPQKDFFIYATTRNSYIAMYRIGPDNLELMWEKQFKEPDYTITGTKLRYNYAQPDGVFSVAFTKDFIVCLVKDFQNDATGRDIRTAPKAAYLFDYEGQLRHIFDLPYHSLRLAADAQSNIFYSTCLEPDNSIVMYDLSTVGL